MAQNPWEMSDEELAAAAGARAARSSGVIYGSPRPTAPPAPPSGYRPAPGGLAPIPGGPEDPNRPQPTRQPEPLSQRQRLDIRNRFDALGAFERTIGELENLYQTNLQGDRGGVLGFGGSRNVRARLPLAPTGYDTLDQTSGRLIDQIMQTFDITGGEANSLAELRARFGPYMPSSSDNDQTIESKLSGLRAILDERRAAVGGQMEAVGIAPPQAVNQNRGSQTDASARPIVSDVQNPVALSGGDEQIDPAHAPLSFEVRLRLSNMLKNGAPDAQIAEYAREVGLSSPSVARALIHRRSPEFREWRRQRPDDIYPLIDEAPNVPMGAIEGAVAGAAGSGPGTALVNASPIPVPIVAGLTGGSPELARAGVDAGRRENPWWALGGQVLGAGATYAGGGAVANSLARGGGRFASLLKTPTEYSALTPRAISGDALFGAVQGWGENEDALDGAGRNMLGGMFGRFVPRAAAGAISPTGGNLSELYAASRNFRPTFGQRFRGTGWAGDAANLVEEAAQGVPGLGRIIATARQGARDDAQGSLWNQALSRGTDAQGAPFRLPTGVTSGVEAQRAASASVDDIYDRARSGLTFRLDGDWSNDLAGIQQARALLPSDAQRRFDTLFEREVGRRLRNSGGALAGDDFKVATSELGREINTLRRNYQQNSELIGALEQVDDALHAGARRHSPPEAVQLLDEADRMFSGVATLQDAARRRLGGADADPGDFSGSDILQSSRNQGVRGGRFLRGETQFFDEASRMRQLEDVLPTSGTSERTAVMNLPQMVQDYAPAATLAAGAGAGSALAGVDPLTAGSVASIPFLLASRRARNMLAPNQSAIAQALADRVRRGTWRGLSAPRLTGMFGAPATTYATEPEPGY